MRPILLLLLALVPVAAGQPVPGIHVMSYTQPILAVETDEAGMLQTEVLLNETHSWTHLHGQSIIHIKIQYILGGDVLEPTARLQLRWDGAAVPGCSWRIEAGSGGARSNAGVALSCPLPSWAAPGPHSVAVDATEATGIQSATITLILEQTETISMDIDVNVTPEIMAHLAWILWIAYFLMTRFIRNTLMAVLASLVGFGILALPIDENQFILLAAAQSLALFYDTARTVARME